MLKSTAAIFALALAAMVGAPAQAQLPPGVYAGEHDLKLATTGAYALDAGHTAVIAKVSHIGYALSVFRFDKVEGTLTWDAAQPSKSSLNVSVDTASIVTPVPGFATELAGDNFLKSASFPKATFISTAFHQTDASHGTVEGQFTLMGKTHPVTFEVDLEGAGKGFGGHPRLGVQARGQINPQDYGLPAMFGPAIWLVIDAEFAQA